MTKQDLHIHHKHIPKGTIPEGAKRLAEEIKEIAAQKTGAYKTHEHSLRLPLDPSIMLEVRHHAERYFSTQLRYVIVVGIGGSNLGTQAVYDALRPRDHATSGSPKIIFADTISTSFLRDVAELLETEISYPEEILINLISKSGGTTESIANFELIYVMLTRRFPSINSRIVVTTDHGSKLWLAAEKKGIGLLSIPKEVGGRFSVFSAVGLFPLALVGIDTKQFVEGARDVLALCTQKENHALRLAESIYLAHKNGASILNFFFFNPELESLGKWARQLYAESLGKEKDRGGRVIRAGITPIVSIGSTDLHSMAQLYFGGPRDKMTIFVHVSERSNLRIPEKGLFIDLAPALKNKSPDIIMKAIYDGTIAAYNTHKFPYGEVLLPAISPYALGMFLELHMMTVMYLGEMLHVNTFDQPNVEDYKKVTKQLLENHK
jgi:glucose-6-phosphate isomerase